MQRSSNQVPHSFARSLAIIPARGGSKGLPRKNVRPLGGVPLIGHTIRAALGSGVERVIVSTDDDEIAAVAQEYGAEIPFRRPAALASDSAKSLSVLLHALSFMENEAGMQVDQVVFLQPTSPFRNQTHLAEAMQQHREHEKRSTVSVTSVDEYHPYFMFTMHEKASLQPLFELDERPLRRQDLPVFYRLNGALYITNREYYDHCGENDAIFDWHSLSGYVMDAPSSVDINDYLDFQRAELQLAKETETGP